MATVNSLLHLNGGNGSTTIVDEYGNSWSCVGSAALSTTNPKFGSASLLSSGVYGNWILSTAFSTVGATFTFEGWFKLSDKTVQDQILFSFNNAGDFGIALYFNNQYLTANKLSLFASSDGTTWNLGTVEGSKSDYVNDTWYKVVVDYDGSTYRVYVGTTGTLAQDLTISSASVICAIANSHIGQLTGYIDEARLLFGNYRYGSTAPTAETAEFFPPSASASPSVSPSASASVSPSVSPSPVAGSDYRVPTSDTSVQWSRSTGASNYALVDEYPSQDDADYCYQTVASSYIDYFGFTPFNVPSNATVQNVKMYVRGKSTGTGQFQARIYRDADHTNSVTLTLTGSFSEVVATWATNPWTAAAWTVADINGTGDSIIRFGYIGAPTSGHEIDVSRVYLEVNYTSPYGASVSPSVSASGSSSVSPSASFSNSPSLSPSASLSPSISPSVSPSVSFSASPSVSPSVSFSVSPSASPSISYSASPSMSPSHSPSPSLGSGSVSPSASPSISLSQSPSLSPSASLSPSISPSGSPSISVSASPSVSPSLSISASPSKSPSVSPSESWSRSPSRSPSGSPSLSPSSSMSPSRSHSGSPSASPSGSPSVSISKSPSVSPSGSPSVSPSVSISGSPSVSLSKSPSGSPSVSVSISPSRSPSPSPTVSPSIYPYYGTCWGYATPDVDEIPVSWQAWEMSAGVPGIVEGDPDWGKMEVSEGSPLVGSIVDTQTINAKRITVLKNKYGVGSGNVLVYIRGSDTIFDQFDLSPTWSLYSTVVNQVWRYVQLKMEYSV